MINSINLYKYIYIMYELTNNDENKKMCKSIRKSLPSNSGLKTRKTWECSWLCKVSVCIIINIARVYQGSIL